MRFAFIAAVIFATWPAAAAPPQFPGAYRGVWTTVGEGTEVGAGAPTCKASDFDEHTNDGLVSVKGASVSYWESGCDLNALAQTDVGTINLSMSCSGEGTNYKSKETWTVRKVQNEDTLVMTIPSRSMISLYVRCH